MYVCMHVCTRVCLYIYIYIYIYTHTHLHTLYTQALCSAALHLPYEALLEELEGVIYEKESHSARLGDRSPAIAIKGEHGAETFLRKRMASATPSPDAGGMDMGARSFEAANARSSWTVR